MPLLLLTITGAGHYRLLSVAEEGGHVFDFGNLVLRVCFFGRATDSLCGGTQRTLLRAVHVPFKVMPVELGQLLWLLVLFCRPGLDPGL